MFRRWRRQDGEAPVKGPRPLPDVERFLPSVSDAWCTLCERVADLTTALVIENRAILCAACVDAVALAAAEARTPGPETNE
jgi:hypothetical protein